MQPAAHHELVDERSRVDAWRLLQFLADQRRILIDGISAKSNFALRKRLRLWD